MEDEVASEVHHARWLLRGWVQIHWSKALREPTWQLDRQRKSLSANKYYVTDCHIQCACASDCVNWCHLTYQCSLSLVSHSIPYFDSKIVATERTAEYLWTMLPTNMNVGSLIPRHSTQIVITFTIACFHVVTYAQGLEESRDTWCFQIKGSNYM